MALPYPVVSVPGKPHPDTTAVQRNFEALVKQVEGPTLEESADPAAPAANGVRLYARDNGAGKTQLCARFATGAVQIIATEP